jgi:nucleoporin NUP82
MITFASDGAFDGSSWLDSLPKHAIFTHQVGGQGRQCMAVRNSDLLVSNGSSIRMTSLLDFKNRTNSLSSSSTSSSTSPSGSFKELVSDALDFDIVELILNPKGKLLAVVGSHKVVILVLPRPGVYSSASTGSQVSVKAAAVGAYYYHERIGGKARIASVRWHPLGQLGSSLLIRSKDGLLR